VSVTPQQIKAFLLAKKLRSLNAESAAKEVRAELLAALDEDRRPVLTPEVVAHASRAEPYGEFPSHRTLMLCYRHELPCTTSQS